MTLGALTLGHVIQKRNRAMRTIEDWFGLDLFGKEDLPTPAITVLAGVLPGLLFISGKLNGVNFGGAICNSNFLSQGRRQLVTFLLRKCWHQSQRRGPEITITKMYLAPAAPCSFLPSFRRELS